MKQSISKNALILFWLFLFILIIPSAASSSTRLSQQPAVCLGIVFDNELVYARGFGLADAETKIPATPETLFRIGSITKLFTSKAIMLCLPEKMKVLFLII